MNWRLYGNLLIFAILLAVLVVVLGAFTRLADAGLGCPDWPGCYGHITAPTAVDDVSAANRAYPERPVEFAKAIKEMVHRYFAGGLILTVFFLMLLAWKNRGEKGSPIILSTFVFFLILFQAVLGMWTVTWKLNPLIVMSHLLGGFTTLALLWLMTLRVGRINVSSASGAGTGLKWAAAIGLVLVAGQIALGGWTSSNYAALACPDFPTCQTQWWPAMDWTEGFVLWRGIGQDYEFGILEPAARTAIHMAHRVGALITFVYLAVLTMIIMKGDASSRMKMIAGVVLSVLLVQVGLGISNIVFALPLVVATAHNAVGAILLLGLVTLVYATYQSGKVPEGIMRGE